MTLNRGESSCQCIAIRDHPYRPNGSLVFNVFAAVAEFECNLIGERTVARDDNDSLTLAATFEENQLHVPTQKTTYSTQDQPLWVEAFRTGTDCVLIEMSEPKRMRLINRPDSEWVPRIDNPSERAERMREWIAQGKWVFEHDAEKAARDALAKSGH